MNPKPTLFFILPDLEQGGAERIVTTLLQQLPAHSYTLYLVLLRKQGYYLQLLPDNVEIIDLQISRIRFSVFPILSLIRKRKPDVVFCGLGELNALLSPFLPLCKHTRFIARETNVVSQHVQRKEIKFFYSFYNNYDAIVAQSTDMKEDLINNFHIKESKIHLIHNPVNIDFIREKKEEFYPEEFQTSSKKVVAIGNISYRKGFDQLLKVFQFLKEDSIELFIIGEGPQRQEFTQLKQDLSLSKVHFLGSRKNPYPYLNYADLFVLSSRYEGFPNVLLEAGACGTFSLANDCKGGIDEIIIPHLNGEISSIENHQEFAQKIKELVHLSHDKTAIEASIETRFNQHRIIEQYEELFQSFFH